MNKNIKLSIVVPIYNVEKYLGECLDSFVNQTNHDFHVLLIDDGSKDKSGEIAKGYEKKYPKLFKYVYQENKGLGGARNTGLSLVDSEYTMFFDSDDFMANLAVENILKEINKNKVDIIFFNPVIYDMGTCSYEPWHDSSFVKDWIFRTKKVINPQKNPILMETEASVCRAIWKTDFLKRINLRFLEHCRWEDVPPHFLLMHEATSASFMEYEGAYFYRTNSGSQITSGSGKSRLDMQYIYKEIEPYFKSKHWSKQEKSHMIGFLSNYLFWSIHVIDDEYRIPFINICHNFFKKISLGQYLHFYFKTKICLRNKIMIWFLKSNIWYKKLFSREKMNQYMKIFNTIKRKLGK